MGGGIERLLVGTSVRDADGITLVGSSLLGAQVTTLNGSSIPVGLC